MPAALAPTYLRLWIVSEDPGPEEKGVLEGLDKRYPYVSQKIFTRISITLYALHRCEPATSAGRSTLIGSEPSSIRG